MDDGIFKEGQAGGGVTDPLRKEALFLKSVEGEMVGIIFTLTLLSQAIFFYRKRKRDIKHIS
jgi:hypothetical protein